MAGAEIFWASAWMRDQCGYCKDPVYPGLRVQIASGNYKIYTKVIRCERCGSEESSKHEKENAHADT